jgi:molybdenum cofactor cytidylyltransferase
MSERTCAAVILAAGASTRLGQPKQLVPIDGEPLLLRTVRMAREAGCNPIIVVLGFDAERMRKVLIDAPVLILENEEWRSGMGSSLRRGVAVLEKLEPRSPDALVLVCDQTALSGQLLRELRRAHTLGLRSITASRYAGRAGVPAIFSAQHFPELLQLEGDRGARGIIERHGDDVTIIEFEDGVKDLDTPEQLHHLS